MLIPNWVIIPIKLYANNIDSETHGFSPLSELGLNHVAFCNIRYVTFISLQGFIWPDNFGGETTEVY